MLGPVELVLAFLSAAATSTLLTPLVARLARGRGVVAPPRPDRWGSRPTPLLGGLAIMVGIFLPAALFAPAARPFALVALGTLGAFVLGAVDDVRGLRPTSKLVGQVAIASGLALGGIQIEIVEVQPVAFLLTLLWVVAMMNALNLTDNMDGLAAGVAAIAAGVLVFMAPPELGWIRVVAACTAGACAGFLVHNFAPASIYMGDAGSQALGFLLSSIALLLTHDAASNVGLAVLAPLLVLGLPVFDTALVAVTRHIAGRPVSSGGRDHASHRLAALGLGERATVLVLYGVALLFAAAGLFSVGLGFAAVPITALLIVALVLFGVFLAENPTTSDGRARSQVIGAGRTLVRFGGEIFLDVILASVALFTAYMLRFEHLRPSDWVGLFVRAAPVLIPIQLGAFVLLGVYRTLWRFLSVSDLVSIFRAVVVGTLMASVIILYPLGQSEHGRALFLVDGVVFATMVIGSRSFLVWLRHWSDLRRSAGGRRVLIVGATSAGELALRSLLRRKDRAYDPAGFIDDDPGMARRRIAGVPVVGRASDLEIIIDRERADFVLVALEDAGERRSMRERCERKGVEALEFTDPW